MQKLKTVLLVAILVVSIDTWDQGNTALCWAASTMLIGSYKTDNTSWTPYEIADELGIDYYKGGMMDETVDAFDECYGINATHVDGYYSSSNLSFWIDQDRPLYTSWTRDGMGHAMTLCGYYPGTNKIRLSDTNVDDYIDITPNSSGRYVYSWDGKSYTYSDSITVPA